MIALPDIELSTLRPEELPLAAGVAARGMRDNPSSIALAGEDPVHRLQILQPVYQWVLSTLQQPCLVARRGNVIVGIAAMAPPSRCFYRQIMEGQKRLQIGGQSVSFAIPPIPWRLVPSLLWMGPRAMARTSQWGEEGVRHDPDEPHQHVELVAVEAGLQGLGIGTLMMEELCREMDLVGVPAYLETDKEENLRFYQRFGFEVTGESSVLDTTNWYMQRR